MSYNGNKDWIQVIQAAWDETNQVLKTSASIDVSGGITVAINHIDDSIAIGDGGGSARKAAVNTDLELIVYDGKTKTAVDAVNTTLAAFKSEAHTDTLATNTALGTVNTNLGTINTSVQAVKTSTDAVKTAVDLVTASLLPLRPYIDYDNWAMTLSAGNTVETYVFKMGVTTKRTAVVTFTDNTRTVASGCVLS